MDVFEEGLRKGFESGASRVGFAGFDFRKKDPKALAAFNLNRALSDYPEFTKEARTNIQNEFYDMPNLSVMNLPVLAAVLSFLRAYPEPTPEDFQDETIVEYFKNLFPDRLEDRERFIIRMKAQFLKYIIAVKDYQ